jgi:hypothetical protein
MRHPASPASSGVRTIRRICARRAARRNVKSGARPKTPPSTPAGSTPTPAPRSRWLIELHTHALRHFAFWGRLPNLSHQQALGSLRLFAEHVAPRVRHASDPTARATPSTRPPSASTRRRDRGHGPPGGREKPAPCWWQITWSVTSTPSEAASCGASSSRTSDARCVRRGQAHDHLTRERQMVNDAVSKWKARCS